MSENQKKIIRKISLFILVSMVILIVAVPFLNKYFNEKERQKQILAERVAEEKRAAKKVEEKKEGPAFEIKPEIYGDPAIFDSPRLQFVSTYPDKYSPYSIWSVKTDGTDLRQVLSREQLFPEEDGFVQGIPKRSPDNRYICATLDDLPNGFHRVLFDLKTGAREVIVRHGQSKNISWLSDSRTVVFPGGWGIYKGGDRLKGVYKYDVINKKLTVYDESKNRYFFWSRILIHPLNNHIFADGEEHTYPLDDGGYTMPEDDETKYGVCIFKPDWTKIKMFPTRNGINFDVSPDGKKLLMGNVNDGLYIYSVEKEEIIYQQKKGAFSSIFSEDSKSFYNSNRYGFNKIRLSDGKIIQSVKLPVKCSALTLINL